MTDRTLYKGPIDCLIKTVTHEGPQALGSLHLVLLFVLVEIRLLCDS
jgi:hypothetical protein